jgi:hypothetical protein
MKKHVSSPSQSGDVFSQTCVSRLYATKLRTTPSLDACHMLSLACDPGSPSGDERGVSSQSGVRY